MSTTDGTAAEMMIEAGTTTSVSPADPTWPSPTVSAAVVDPVRLMVMVPGFAVTPSALSLSVNARLTTTASLSAIVTVAVVVVPRVYPDPSLTRQMSVSGDSDSASSTGVTVTVAVEALAGMTTLNGTLSTSLVTSAVPVQARDTVVALASNPVRLTWNAPTFGVVASPALASEAEIVTTCASLSVTVMVVDGVPLKAAPAGTETMMVSLDSTTWSLRVANHSEALADPAGMVTVRITGTW